ncbi:MAG: CaiB/BaiF CoA-transferase family protein [Gammaproteobacteria bacterium]|nr:CaiB/BaiF CoA-transferase family protein [Gammaproteobacteria bacterium]
MQPFAAIRVIDLTHVIAGPFCAYQLAALGADVIKVESPARPDMSRASGAGAAAPAGMASDFTAQNANKRAVCIDLKSSAGAAVMRRLIATADVLVENYRSGALDALGFGYAAVKALRPDMIYCSLTGFGQHGPHASRTAYDNVIQAYSGLMAATGDAATAPMKVGPPVLDYGSGIQAAFAIAAALFQRASSGRGQYIDVSMLDAAIMFMSSHVMYAQAAGRAPPNTGNDHASNAGYACYATADGRLMLGAYTGAQARDMWTVLGDAAHGLALAELTPAGMAAHFDRDRPRIAGLLLAHSADHWEAEFNRRRVPAAKVRTLEEALAGEQLQARTVLQTVDSRAGDGAGDGDGVGDGAGDGADGAGAGDGVGDGAGDGADGDSGDHNAAPMPKFPVAGFQFAAPGSGPALRRPPPAFAQHTAEVLRELGYDDAELARLHAAGAIRLAADGEADAAVAGETGAGETAAGAAVARKTTAAETETADTAAAS